MTQISRILIRAWIAWLARRSDQTLRRLARRLFTRTSRQLDRASAAARDAQQRRLLTTLTENRDTEYGRRYGFSEMETIDDFRARVPIRAWDDFAPWVDRMVQGESNLLVAEPVFFYATTSGTTGRRKLIPVTSRFLEECRVATRVLMRTTFDEMPGVVRGKRLNMRSPSVETLRPGVEAGSITVALSGGLTGAESALDAVPLAVFSVQDFESRYRLCIRFAAQENITLVSAVNPSTLLLFAQTLEHHWESIAEALEEGGLGRDLTLDDEMRTRLEPRARRAPDAARRIRESAASHGGVPRLQDLWPNLAGLVCWKGGSAPWYLQQLERSYGKLPILDYGYAASEGCFGAPLSAEGAASALFPHGHFIELMDESRVEEVRAGRSPTTLLDEAEVGRRYYVVVTTGAGLYRYDMNDIVEVVGKFGQIPLVTFRQKGGAMASLTGEKVGEAHVVDAMERALRDSGMSLAGFVAGPILPPDETSAPAYLVAFDVGQYGASDAELEQLSASFDHHLQSVNSEYEAKRNSLRLAPVECVRLPSDAVARYRERRVREGAPDAHVKIPHVTADGALFEKLGIAESAPHICRRLLARSDS